LAGLWLVLYVVTVHGLPALHQAFHRNDHVHEMGGLRWVRRASSHRHVGAEASAAHPSAARAAAARPGAQASMRADTGDSVEGLPPHQAAGPAHASSALLTPSRLLSLAPCPGARARDLIPVAPSTREIVRHPRARAPPAAV
jgi:hypothetical protein